MWIDEYMQLKCGWQGFDAYANIEHYMQQIKDSLLEYLDWKNDNGKEFWIFRFFQKFKNCLNFRNFLVEKKFWKFYCRCSMIFGNFSKFFMNFGGVLLSYEFLNETALFKCIISVTALIFTRDELGIKSWKFYGRIFIIFDNFL